MMGDNCSRARRVERRRVTAMYALVLASGNASAMWTGNNN